MNIEIPPPLYHQVRLELARIALRWENLQQDVADNVGPMQDVNFVNFATLYQHSRCFMRLLGEDYAEETCVVSETLCTLILSGFVQDSLPLRRQAAQAMKDLARLTRWHMDGADTVYGEKHAINACLYKDALRLQRYVNANAPHDYQHFSRVFPVNAYEDDGVFLCVRGFDLLRLDAEALSLYLLEFDWKNIIERGGSFNSLFSHFGLNGHVFDVCYAAQAYCEPTVYEGGVIRLLYGTPLEFDFVQAISRLPESQIFVVDKTRIFSHEPSWGRAENAPCIGQSASQAFTMDDLAPLISAYDKALNKAFADAKAPRPFEPWEES